MKRSKEYRLEQDKRIIKNRIKDIKTTESNGSEWVENLMNEANRMNKKHPYDCGKSDCEVCNRYGRKDKLHEKKVLRKKPEVVEGNDE
jgi:ferredoxin